MKVLVTGATGLLGNNLVRKLVNRGFDVRCAVRSRESEALIGLPLEEVETDFGSETDWQALIEGCDVLIHCAAMIHLGWTRMDEAHQVNVELTERLARASRLQNCRMIHVSSVDTLAYSVDGSPVDENKAEPLCPPCNYVVTKTEAEKVVKIEIEQGLDAVIVHPGFLIGGWDWKPSSGKMLLAISKRQIPLAPAGGCSAVDVDDVVRALISLIEIGDSGQHYILGGHNILYADLFQQIEAVVGGRAPRWVMRPGVAMVAGIIGDTVTKVIGRETDFNSGMIRMGQIKHFYDSSKAARELGYSISPLQGAIESCWEFIKDHHLAH